MFTMSNKTIDGKTQRQADTDYRRIRRDRIEYGEVAGFRRGHFISDRKEDGCAHGAGRDAGHTHLGLAERNDAAVDGGVRAWAGGVLPGRAAPGHLLLAGAVDGGAQARGVAAHAGLAPLRGHQRPRGSGKSDQGDASSKFLFSDLDGVHHILEAIGNAFGV